MQNAPSVVYPVGHSAFYRWTTVGIGLLALFAIGVGWWSSVQAASNVFHVRWAIGLVLGLLWVGVALRQCTHATVGVLKWDAQAPPKELDGRPGAWAWGSAHSRLQVLASAPNWVFDGQSRVLLKVSAVDGAACWVWAEREAEPLKWDDFRRALAATTI